MSVDTSNYDDYFDSGTKSPVAPDFYCGDDFNLGNYTNNNVYTLFEGDTSYTEIYKNALATFVKEHDQNSKTSYQMRKADDFIDGYYRASIETSIDVVLKVNFNAFNVSGKYSFTEYEYYFFFNKNNTFPVAEYNDTTSYGSTGNKLSFGLTDLENVMNEVVGE